MLYDLKWNYCDRDQFNSRRLYHRKGEREEKVRGRASTLLNSDGNTLVLNSPLTANEFLMELIRELIFFRRDLHSRAWHFLDIKYFNILIFFWRGCREWMPKKKVVTGVTICKSSNWVLARRWWFMLYRGRRLGLMPELGRWEPSKVKLNCRRSNFLLTRVLMQKRDSIITSNSSFTKATDQ